MRSHRVHPALLALPAALLAACSSPSTETVEDPRPVVRLGGDETLTERLLPALAETHTKARSTLRFQVRRTEGNGIQSLLDGGIDIAATSTDHLPRDQEQAKERGFDLHAEGARHIIGVDVIAVAVHASNPTDSLTYDQVIGIFCEGPQRIDNWSFLGMEDKPVRALGRKLDDGARMVFEEFFCGGRGLSSNLEILNPLAMQTALEEDPNAVAFLSLNEESGKVLGLRPDVAQPPIRPSQQQVIRGAYPLYRDVYLYTPGPAVSHPSDFIEWVQSPAGQEVLDEQRYVPLFLRPEQADEPRPLRETIHYDPGAAVPNQRSSARLQLLVQELKERAGEYRHIVLEGYTDNREPDSVVLSRKRAETVREVLGKELPGVYFEIIPRGSDRPLAPNTTEFGRQRNRRVQVYLAEEEDAQPEGDMEPSEG